MVKKILSILAWVATGAALIALFIAARENYLNTPVKAFNVQIGQESDSGFVKKSDVHDVLGQLCGTSKIGTVNMAAIEKQLESDPWVEQSSAYIDLDGTLNVSIKEYHPTLRLFGSQGQTAYITSNGMLLPPSGNHTPYLLVANGNFLFDPNIARQLSDTIEADRNIIGAMKLNEAINRNKFIKSCTGQIYCTNGNEFEIVVRGVEARIIVGDTTHLDDKLKRLEIFLKQKAASTEIGEMKKINLKYKNQLVCTKKQSHE